MPDQGLVISHLFKSRATSKQWLLSEICWQSQTVECGSVLTVSKYAAPKKGSGIETVVENFFSNLTTDSSKRNAF